MSIPLRRLLFGRPLATARQKHEKLSKFLALPVFASDAISSNAYATEEILLAFAQLGIMGAIAWQYAPRITVAIVILLAIVVVSYRLTIFSYPQGGGSYIVTKENYGATPGLVAAASLLVDYVMTVAVSISSGVAAIISVHPFLAGDRVWLAIVAVAIVALANLRGLRESGTLFAVPTYSFVLFIGVMIITGLFHVITGHAHPVNASFPDYSAGTSLPFLGKISGMPFVGIFALLVVFRAFASGCAAMTGTEAVADGIPAFRAPESRNAATTLVIMACILGFLFMGISVLAQAYHAIPYEKGYPTVVSQIAQGVFGRGWFFSLIQYATAAILILAANTAYQDFPRLSSILARDRFAPRQLLQIGDRLVFSNGIIFLSVLAALFIVLFKAEVSALIPLYATGVFISFTLSQYSMSKRLSTLKQPGWRIYSSISKFGAIVTAAVAFIIGSMKWAAGPKIPLFGIDIPTGAYIVILLLIPATVWMLLRIHHHYITLGEQLRISGKPEPREIKSTSIVLTSGLHKGILQAIDYARTLSHDCRALYIEVDPTETPLVRERWEQFGMTVPLVILESQYRSVIKPTLDYLEEAKRERPDHVVTVVIPEFVPKKWWHKALHGQSGFFLKLALSMRRDIVVTNVRYFLER